MLCSCFTHALRMLYENAFACVTHALLILYSFFTHALLMLYENAVRMLYSCFACALLVLCSCFTHALSRIAPVLLYSAAVEDREKDSPGNWRTQ